MEERDDAGSPAAVDDDGRRGASLKAGEKLRVDAVWNDDVTEAESASVTGDVFWVAGLWLGDGRRGSMAGAGEMGRENEGGTWRVVGRTLSDRRCASSAFCRRLAAVMGSILATDADRCWTGGRSPRGSMSTILGRPAWAYETATAMSQLLPLAHLEMDIVFAVDSADMSWTTASS